jgi:hypothetical protein
MRQKRLFVILLGGLLASAVGCSRSRPVQVLVTLDNKPLEGATVALIGDPKVENVYGVTGADGIATLDTPKKTGIPAGTYKVIVTKIAGSKTGAPPDMKNMEEVRKMMTGASAEAKNELHPKYAGARNTPLTLKVPPDNVPAKLELKSNP